MLEEQNPTRDELIEAVRRAYAAMYQEYMPCPWCSGHIGYHADKHDDDCIAKKVCEKQISDLFALSDEHRLI